MGNKKKRTYKITHYETLVGVYYVEADSEDDAIEVFQDMVGRDEIRLETYDMEQENSWEEAEPAWGEEDEG